MFMFQSPWWRPSQWFQHSVPFFWQFFNIHKKRTHSVNLIKLHGWEQPGLLCLWSWTHYTIIPWLCLYNYWQSNKNVEETKDDCVFEQNWGLQVIWDYSNQPQYGAACWKTTDTSKLTLVSVYWKKCFTDVFLYLDS